MIDQDRTDRAFEALSAGFEISKMIHQHFQSMAHLDRPGELDQAAGESLSYSLRQLILSALADLERE